MENFAIKGILIDDLKEQVLVTISQLDIQIMKTMFIDLNNSKINKSSAHELENYNDKHSLSRRVSEWSKLQGNCFEDI